MREQKRLVKIIRGKGCSILHDKLRVEFINLEELCDRLIEDFKDKEGN